MQKVIGGVRLLLAVMLLLAGGAAFAQGTVKIGVVAEFSGPFAETFSRPINPFAPTFTVSPPTTVASPELSTRITTGGCNRT